MPFQPSPTFRLSRVLFGVCISGLPKAATTFNRSHLGASCKSHDAPCPPLCLYAATCITGKTFDKFAGLCYGQSHLLPVSCYGPAQG